MGPGCGSGLGSGVLIRGRVPNGQENQKLALHHLLPCQQF